MVLNYNGVDISNQTSIRQCEIEQYLDGHIDTMTLAFTNADGKWTGWMPQTGDAVRVTEEHVDSGQMYVMAIRPEEQRMIMDCAPLLQHQAGRIRQWSKPSLMQLAKGTAEHLGLSLECYGVTDQSYLAAEQKGESDLSFLSKLCRLEGLRMMVTDGKIRLISDDYLDGLVVTDYTLEASTYRIHDDNYYTGSEVTDGTITGKAGNDSGEVVSSVTLKKLESIGQANRFAANLLRAANRDRKGGNVIVNSLLGDLMPGAKIKFTCDYWTEQPVLITRTRHDLVKGSSKIWFSLEG